MSEPLHDTWRSREALLLAKAVGVASPADAIVHKVQSLLQIANTFEPPVSPFRIAKYRNVSKILISDLAYDAILEPLADGFLMRLNRNRSLYRRRFSCAHELGHTFFYEMFPERGALAEDISELFDQRQEEERLCNIAARELLLPRSMVLSRILDSSINLETVMATARVFDASYPATALRLIELFEWKCALIVWDVTVDDTTKELVPRVSWSASRLGFIPPHPAKAPRSWIPIIVRALDNPGVPTGITECAGSFGGLKTPIAIDSLCINYQEGYNRRRTYLLSLAIPG